MKVLITQKEARRGGLRKKERQRVFCPLINFTKSHNGWDWAREAKYSYQSHMGSEASFRSPTWVLEPRLLGHLSLFPQPQKHGGATGFEPKYPNGMPVSQATVLPCISHCRLLNSHAEVGSENLDLHKILHHLFS